MYHRAAFHGSPVHLNSTRFTLAQNLLPSAPLHSHIEAVRLRILARLPALSSHYAVIMIGTRHLYYVHGTRGRDLTEPKASVAYKYTAITHEPRMQELRNDWQRCGYKPFHLPVGVMRRRSNQKRALP